MIEIERKLTSIESDIENAIAELSCPDAHSGSLNGIKEYWKILIKREIKELFELYDNLCDEMIKELENN